MSSGTVERLTKPGPTAVRAAARPGVVDLRKPAPITSRTSGAVEEIVDAEVVAAPPPKKSPAGRRVIHAVGRIRETHPLQRAAASRPGQAAGRAAKAAPRVGTRTIYTLLLGHVSWVKRGVAYASHGALREQVRISVAMGDREAIKLWDDQLEHARDARVRRLKDLPRVVGAVIATVGILALTVALLLLLGGVAVALYRDGMDWDSWWEMVATGLDWIGWLVQSAVFLGLVATVPVYLWAAWREGKRYGLPPRWMVSEEERAEMDSVIDERMIALALANVGIAALNAFFKEGGRLQFTVMPRVDGEGTYAQVKLCMGVTAEEIAAPKPRAKLAGNLHRAVLETWPTVADEAGLLDLWVADKGKLNAGAGPWPLLDNGTVDAFEGVPLGRSQRGDVLLARVFETNWLIGGRPGQGKSACMRCLLLGIALDPTTEIQLFVMGESPDFAPLAPRLSRYAMGMDDSVAEQAIQALRDALVEMERRGKVLGAQPGTPPKTNRQLADNPKLGLHLLVIAIDECHELFQHPDLGKEAAALTIRLIKRGRKYGICLILATQSPTKDSIPRDVTRNVTCGVAFSVADHVANDGLLGTGKYKAGIRATELRPNVDRGAAVTVGITDNAFELIRTFFIPFGDGVDEVTPVVARAMTGITRLRRTGEQLAEIEPPAVDPLVEIWESLEQPREELRAVLPRLRNRQPDVFGRWNQNRLVEYLADEEVPVGMLKGYRTVLAADVEERLNSRLVDLGG